MTLHAPQMPAEADEQIIANVAQPLRGSGGFISHAAEITTDGVTVTEVWETERIGSGGSTHPAGHTYPPTHPNHSPV
jgi:hypothetical protein